MRIVVAATHQELVGGAETYVRWLLPELVERGHQVAFAFQYACSNDERAIDRNVPSLVRLFLGRERNEVLAEIAAFAPDLIFLQGLDDSVLEGELAQLFPCILFAHGFFGACLTGFKRHAFPEPRPCNRRFGPACIPVNYLLGCGPRHPLRLLQAFATQSRKSITARSCAAVVVASHYMKSMYEREGLSRDQLHVIPCPTVGVQQDPEPPAPRAIQGRLLFMGRITGVKGLDHAIRAADFAQQRLQRALTLCIAGEGSELEQNLRLATQLGLRVDVMGWIEGDQKLETMRSADLLIVPSTWPEPFGLVGIEAGCVGLPSVAYGVGGVMEWLRPGESGESAGPGPLRPAKLGRAIVGILRSEERLNRLRIGAWRMAAEFQGARHMDQLERVFATVTHKTAETKYTVASSATACSKGRVESV